VKWGIKLNSADKHGKPL